MGVIKMTVQIVRENGHSELIQDVNRIEADKENKITLYLDYCTTEIPCCKFTSIIILKN